MLNLRHAALVALVALSMGCGASSFEIAASAADAMHSVQVESGPRIRQLRRDAMLRAATTVHDHGGAEDVAQAAATAEGHRWDCAVSTHQIYSMAVGSFIDALFLAQVEHRDFQLTDALPYLTRGAQTYREIVSCLHSLGNDDLPDAPLWLRDLPGPWSLRLDATEDP
jgi:hypothetical protein